MEIRSATIPVVVFSAVSFCLLTTSCASIVSGNHQNVSVETPPLKNVTCSLSNDKGKWYVNSTPGSVMLQQSYKDLSVSCDQKGHEPVTKLVPSKTKPMVFGNILFGGIIGIIVDIADGAAYGYPQTITVPMEK